VAAVRTVKVTLEANTTGFVAGMATARKSLGEFGAEMDVLAVKHSGSFSKLTNVAAGVGVALVGAFALAERAAYGFDKQMSAVDSVLDHSNMTAKQSAAQLTALREAAIQAGRDTAFTATQAAQAEEELAKAGISAADILGGALKGALTLAAAGDIDLAQAATIAAQAMTEFQLAGKDVGSIADTLVAGANASVTSVSALGESLDQVGSVAHQVHFSLNETVGVLSAFAQMGLVGEEGGTAFKTMLLKLENPTQKSAALMKELGINVYDSSGQFVSAAKLAGILQTSLAGLTEAQRNQALGEIFGTRAVRGAIDLYRLGADGVQQWTDVVSKSGAASEAARTRLDNLAGDVHKLLGSLQALAIEGTSGANAGLRGLAQGAEATVNAFSKLPGWIQQTVTDLTAVSGLGLLAAAGFLKVKGAVQQVNAAMAESGPVGARFSKFLGGAAKFTAIGTAVLVGTGFAVEGLNALAKWADQKEKGTQYKVDDLNKSLMALAETGQATGALLKIAGGDLNSWGQRVANLPLVGANTAQAKTIKEFNNDVGQMDAQLAAMVQSGHALEAAKDVDLLRDAALNAGAPWFDITTAFPQYTKATQDAAAASAGTAKGFADVTTQVSLMNGTLQDAIDKLSTIDAVFKSLNGAQTDVESANIAFQQSLDGLDKALKTNKHSLDIHNQAGRDDMTAILDIIDKAEKATQAEYTLSGSVDKASAVWNTNMGVLRQHLSALGLTKKQIDDLLTLYAKMPPLVSTPVYTPGLDGALVKMGQLYDWTRKVNGKTVTIRIAYNQGSYTILGTGQKFNRWGGLYEHADVGLLRDAHIARAMPRGARYAYAEPRTGGEAFVPKHGDYGRSMAILSAAAGWYNAAVVPGGRGGSRQMVLHVEAQPGAARALVGQLKFTISEMGGVTKALGP